MSQGEARDFRIPVTVVTGFLGAGKTTLLNHWLKQTALKDAAVLINEFGEVGIDHLLVEKIDDDMVLLDSGCLCCSVRGDLSRALRELFMRRLNRKIAGLSRVLIETTGLADPAPVIHTLRTDFFIAERYRLDGVVTAVAVPHIDAQLSRHFEAVKQVAMADRLLLTQCDLASQADIANVSRLLVRLNPGAPQIFVHRGESAVESILKCGLYDPATKPADVRQWLAAEAGRAPHPVDGHHHDLNRHDAFVRAHVLRIAEPVVWRHFVAALDDLLVTVGERILRVKGLVNVTGEVEPRVVQCAQHVRYPATRLTAWPDRDRATQLVVIGREIKPEWLTSAFETVTNAPPGVA